MEPAALAEHRPGRPISVVLLRPIAEYSSRSMERFADEFSSELRLQPSVIVDETSIHATRLARHRLTRQLDRQYSSLLRYPAHARRKSADVFHVLEHSHAPLVRSLPAGRTLVTCHDLMLLHAEKEDISVSASRLTVGRFRWATSFLRRAALVACDSQATADDVVELVGVEPSRVRVIPLGIAPIFLPMSATDRASARHRIDSTDESAIVMHVSTGGGYKNVRGTLHVIDALREQGRRVVFVRVGELLGREDLEFASDRGLLGQIRDFGRVRDEELARLYGAADVLLFPSRWEGFGWPPLEALACGTPSVVASECRAVVDVLGDAMLAASADDVPGLAAAVHRIVNSAELSEDLVQRGRRRVAALTWQRTVEAYLQAYQDILTFH